MRNIIILLSISIFTLFAQNIKDNKTLPQATQLEMFLFKIGFTSLLNDFDEQKNTVQINKNNIDKLKQNINYILQQMNKNKLEQNTIVTVPSHSNNNYKKLEKEIALLKEEIKKLKNNTTKKVTKDIVIQKMIVRVKEANIRKAPYSNALISKKVPFKTIIRIKSCNKYGWCKLQNTDEYIAKFVLK